MEKRGRIHLVRVSIFGKLQNDQILPVNTIALCNVGQYHPQLENYGDVSPVVFYKFIVLNSVLLFLCLDI